MPADAADDDLVPQRENDSVEGPLPTFVIAGTMRSGTTALARWLGAHPEVFMAPGKELHYFDAERSKTLAGYRREFAGWAGQPAVGEATPNYLFARGAMSRLAATVVGVRVVVSLRDPVERAYSHYWARASRSIETRSFAQVVADEQADPTRPAGPTIGAGTSPHLLARGLYLDQITEALVHLPRHDLHVVLFDDLEAEPRQTFAGVCDFVGVDPSVVPGDVGRPANAYRRYRSERLRRWTRQLPSPAADLVGHLNSRAIAYPELDPGLRRDLQNWYRPANQALAEWLGRDLSAWDG